ncbi:acyltransferase [Aurantibacter crassamenti]|uniref:acyltransferase n=1 Tax=Aurantibacter crassamenti TaxID=1837375 RepID=UPI0019398753|nr:acyltransferase [Aurantibacter crassamenti]MBM1105820.1 acyltransferase [Aurantibacter crassamenti]
MGFKENSKASIKKQSWLTKLFRNYRDGYLFTKTYHRNISGNNNTLKISASARLINCEFEINGNNNTITIGADAFFKNVKFFIVGDANSIEISSNVSFNEGGSLWIEDENCEINIGMNSTFENAHLAATESDSKINIGNDCMFAYDIDVRTGDSHAIYDEHTNKRINFAQNVTIGDHVWIGAHASILKGVTIGSNSIVATRSVVTKKYNNENIILAGSPAKIIKENIKWTRDRKPD